MKFDEINGFTGKVVESSFKGNVHLNLVEVELKGSRKTFVIESKCLTNLSKVTAL